MRMVVGAAIGGLVGAAIWAAIGYFTGWEIGWIAWGIGILAGLGVRLAGTREMSYYDREHKRMVTQGVAADGPVAGAIAAAAAVGSVLLGKYAVVHMFLASPVTAFADYVDDETMIASMADEIAYEIESQGRAVNWPSGMDYESASEQKDYPPRIWSQAATKWNALSQSDQEAQKRAQAEALGAALASVDGASSAVFIASFGVLDLLWFGLAAFTAFRIGAASGD